MVDRSLISREFPRKFSDPVRTLDGSRRAIVNLQRLETLWVNTGTLCNLTCENCYIESSPRNDRLSYISRAEVAGYLEELRMLGQPTHTVGFTGGEPFMNPDFLGMLEDTVTAGFSALILTNAMKPMRKCREPLLALQRRCPGALQVRVSMDHFRRELHEEERGRRSWQPMLDGLRWLSEHGFSLSVAGRTRWDEPEADLRAGYAELFESEGIRVNAADPAALVLFPEMDEAAEVPEITEACWDILKVDPNAMMCATSRMVVKRRGATAPSVVACTLLPYDRRFELGERLEDAAGSVPLNHPHCARFCVLGGGSCSG